MIAGAQPLVPGVRFNWSMARVRLRWIAVLVAVVSLQALAAAASAGAVSVSWSGPTLVDHQAPFAVPAPLGPPTKLTNLLGGAIAPAAISCASDSFCALVAPAAPKLLTSRTPALGTGAWQETSVPYDLEKIDCVSARLCVGVAGGAVEVSTNPTAGAAAWRTFFVPAGDEITSIACASAHVCTAAGEDDRNDGIALTTTKPTGGRRAWRLRTLPRGPRTDYGFSNVSCPSVHLCVIAAGEVVTSRAPTSAHPHWRLADVPVREDMTCPNVRLCVDVTGGSIISSTNPAGGAGAWRTTSPTGSTDTTPSVACASAQLCVAVDGSDNVLSSTDPAAGAGAWKLVNLGIGYTGLTGISCVATGGCLAVDGNGGVAYDSNPAAPYGTWTRKQLPLYSITAVSCAPGLCAASGDAHVPLSPPVVATLSASGYAQADIPMDEGIDAISCPSASFCVGGDATGVAVSAGAGGSGVTGTWTNDAITTPPSCSKYGCNYDGITAVSCPTEQMCAATDGRSLWVSSDPTGGAGTWVKSTLPAAGILAISCPTASTCVVAGADSVFSTTDPGGGAPTWTALTVPQITVPQPPLGPIPIAPPSIRIDSLSCATASACVAVDGTGGYALAGNPAGGTWTAIQLDYPTSPLIGPRSLTGVSCETTGLCVAVDGLGEAFVGQLSGE
jgi:hypothetical protein